MAEAYRKPGVYSELIESPTLRAEAAMAKVVAIIGTAPRGSDEPTIFANAYLFNKFIGQENEVSSSLYSLPKGGAVCFEHQPYAVMAMRIGCTRAAIVLDGVLTFTANAAHSGTQGDLITVTIEDGTVSGKKVTVDNNSAYNEIVEEYDNLDTNDAIAEQINASSLVVSVEVATGALVGNTVATLTGGIDGTEPTVAYADWIAGIGLLQNVSPDIIVALTEASNVATYLKTHCLSMAALRKERIMIWGSQAGASIGTIEGMGNNILADTAASTSAGRAVVVSADSARRYNRGTGLIETLDGYYVAAALGGVASSRSVEEPLTRKPLTGFLSLPNKYTDDFMDILAGTDRLCVIEERKDVIVRHGLSTALVSSAYKEISVRRIEDHIIQEIRDSLDDQFIGKPSRPDTAAQIAAACTSLLENYVEDGLINDYANVSCARDPGDPMVYDLSFDYITAYPINIINIQYSLTL